MYLEMLEETRTKLKICRKGFPEGNLKVGYAWESLPAEAPTLEVQIEKMKDCHTIFYEKTTFESGVESTRQEYKKMLEFLQEGDTLVVHDFNRLAVSLPDAVDAVLGLISNNCKISVLKWGIDTSDYGAGYTLESVFRGLAGVLESECSRK